MKVIRVVWPRQASSALIAEADVVLDQDNIVRKDRNGTHGRRATHAEIKACVDHRDEVVET